MLCVLLGKLRENLVTLTFSNQLFISYKNNDHAVS